MIHTPTTVRESNVKTNPSDPTDWSQYIKSMTDIDGTIYEGVNPGLTKRELFAAMAMQGMLANPTLTIVDHQTGYPIAYGVIEQAMFFADSLISKLNVENE